MSESLKRVVLGRGDVRRGMVGYLIFDHNNVGIVQTREERRSADDRRHDARVVSVFHHELDFVVAHSQRDMLSHGYHDIGSFRVWAFISDRRPIKGNPRDTKFFLCRGSG